LRLLLAAALALATVASAADKYPSFAELAKTEKAGADYRITCHDRKSPAAVLAIHAGVIEPGSGELARAVAREDWSLYLFESLKPDGDETLHITSTRFDEPEAVALVERSALCVSLHGMKGKTDAICLGGANPGLRRAVFEGLERAQLGIELEEPCKRLPGVSLKNIGNRCQRQGVQIELSAALRERMRADPSLTTKLGAAIRDGVQAYEKKKESP
jgi:phage replication-related protein YjqB (UPF0714/DUF867 family)